MSIAVLIVGSDRRETGIDSRLAGRALLWGLDRRGVRCDIHDPRTKPAPDLCAYDAVLCWSYAVFRSRDFVRGAEKIEDEARRRGIPVVNSIARCGARHSFFLETWHEHGVPCARSQTFNDFEEIRLEYPLLLRRDGVHQGKDIFLVRSPKEARRLLQERQEDEEQENLDLAVEFVDTRHENGYYVKYRSFIVGERILPAHVFLSSHWLVNYRNLVANDLSERYTRSFFQNGERNVAEVLQAAHLSGSDVLALDYTRRPDGRYLFFEANRHFLMFEDYGKTLDGGFAKATGLDEEGRRKMIETLGLALGDLVIERARSRS